MTSTLVDPYTAALEQPVQERHFFGVATVDSYFCVLQKGVGKRLWDQTSDPISDRRIAIKLSIECAKRENGTYTVDQECLNFERAWVDYTLPSLHELGVTDLRTLNGRAVHGKRVATGEKYTNKNGEQKEKSAIVLLELFDDTESCSAAQTVFYGERSSEKFSMPQADVPLPPSSMSPEQQFALNSLPALWKASGHNAEKFTDLIGQNPLISKYYPSTHPHVQALINATIADDQDLPF